MQKTFYESYLHGYVSTFFYFISLISVIIGIYIIISKNPIISVLFLIALFCSISVYLIMVGLHFLGISYLLVYVGAISILFLFILMLINIRVSELITDNKNSISLAILAALLYNYAINNILGNNAYMYDIVTKYTIILANNFFENIDSQNINSANDILSSIIEYLRFVNTSSVASKSWDSVVIVSTHINSIGNILYTNLFILFIVISLILLLAMIGAIIITISKPKSLHHYFLKLNL